MGQIRPNNGIKYHNFEQNGHKDFLKEVRITDKKSFIMDTVLFNSSEVLKGSNDIELIMSVIMNENEEKMLLEYGLRYFGSHCMGKNRIHYFGYGNQTSRHVVSITTRENCIMAIMELESYCFLPFSEERELKVLQTKRRKVKLQRITYPFDILYQDKLLDNDSETIIIKMNRNGQIKRIKNKASLPRSLSKWMD